MKFAIALLLLATPSFSHPAHQEESGDVSGAAAPDWETDFVEARKKAIRENKPLLIVFR